MTVGEQKRILKGMDDNETVKISGHDVTSWELVPWEGPQEVLHGYLDLVGQ